MKTVEEDIQFFSQSLMVFLNGVESAIKEFQLDKSNNYPPVNIYLEKINKEELLVFEVAVAGFDPIKIKEGISLENNILTIKVDKVEDEGNREYLVKKLAYRKIDKSFKIPMPIESADVEVENGILKITLHPITQKIKINIK